MSTRVISASERPRYWAFISYSHYDRRIARWCRQELARQSVPRAMRKRVEGDSAHFSPVFLDEDSLAAAPVLSDELQTALKRSSHLIVICSPFAVASSYVCEEIRYFQELGRGDRILCLVASGVPNATDDGRPHLECFPEPLRTVVTPTGREAIPAEKRPLAAVMGDESGGERARALRQLTGGLLGLSDHALEKLEYRRKVRRSAAYLGGVAAMILLLVAFVLPWHTYSRAYVRRLGIWHEVDPISRSEATQAGEHYEFVRPGIFGKPTVVKLVDGFGNCTNEGMRDVLDKSFDSACTTSRACEARFAYKQGGIDREVLVDQYGTKLETMSYAEATLGRFSQTAGFGCSQSHGGVSYVQFDRTSDGVDRQVVFLDDPTNSAKPVPRANNDGVYGFRFTYDGKLRVASVTNLSPEGVPQNNRSGFATRTLTYDSRGGLVEQKYYAPDGKTPTLIKDGYARMLNKLDSHGAVLEETFLGVDGKPVASDQGYASYRETRGAHGEYLTIDFFDADGKPTPGIDGVWRGRYQYDRHGNRVDYRYLDAFGKPTSNKDKVAGVHKTYNAQGNPTLIQYFGVDGRLAFNAIGTAQEEKKYDSLGNPVESGYRGQDGQLTRTNVGVAIDRLSFDSKNQVVSSRSYDPQGAPTLTNGFFEWRMTYDNNGNETQRERFGTDNEPTLDQQGISKQTHVFDQAGLETEKRSFGLSNQPALTNDMGDASVVRYEYDALGRKVKEAYFDGAGKPTQDSRNISSYRLALDVKGQALEIAFFGTDGSPVRNQFGGYRFRREYDSRGHQVLIEFEDAAGNAMLGSEGYAFRKQSVDALGNITSARYFGLGMEPVVANGGKIAGYDATYDAQGQQLTYRYAGLNGEAVTDTRGVAGYKYEYNSTGDLIARRSIGVDGSPALDTDGVGGAKSSYDERYREIERVLLDAEGRPIVSPKLKYAIQRNKYNERGQKTESSFFDAVGHPVLRDDGYSILRNTFDSRGNETEERFFDEYGRPAHEKEAARVVMEYNKYGRQIERRFYNAEDKLVKNPTSGRAVVRTQYDDANRIVLETSFDENDRPVNRLDQKYFKKATTYDQRAKATSVCTTVSGGVVPCPKDD